MVAVLDQPLHQLCNFLLSCRIVFLADIKGHIQAGILIEHRAAVAFDGKPVLIQLFQIPPDGLLRYLKFLAQFAHNDLFFFLQLLQNQIPSFYR